MEVLKKADLVFYEESMCTCQTVDDYGTCHSTDQND